MGTMPVKQLIISMSLPMMISMLMQALYSVVDSIFVSHLSEQALAAVTYAFPLQNMMIALGSGTGVGINALLSRSLGERRFDRSDAAANTGLLLTFCNALLFMVIGLFGSHAFIATQTSLPEIREMGATYLSIVCGFSFGLFFQMTFERLLQSTGLTIYSMASQLSGAIINTILDPIMIFGLLGCPRFGVAGAAYATVIGQCSAALIGLALNLKKNTEIRYSFRGILSPKAETIGRIYYVGVPSILMMSIGSAMTYGMNQILSIFSDTAVAVFGVYFKLQSFFFMPVFGLNNGVIPVLAYNYGARKKERIREALRFSMLVAVAIMGLGTLLFQLFPARLLGFFNASEEMLQIGVPALRIISLSYMVAGACIAMGSIFQAFSRSFYSLFVSIGRQLVALLPVAWLLSRTGSVTMVWWAFPIAEVVSGILSVIFFRKLYKEVVDPM
ncbi:MAG: MATE family efflux transporter [Lachnospiraceae bacterium]|nr:MATE family efflux transporter [Lachnospiraceae bacterium]